MIARGSRRFRALEWIASWCLVSMAKIAKRHGDLHEAKHILASMTYGESHECGPNCPYRDVSSAIPAGPLGWEGEPHDA